MAPAPVILATGPLTGGRLARVLGGLCGKPLYFYDAIAPIVDAETIDTAVVFRASRWNRGMEEVAPGDHEAGDYLNCPMTADEYAAFVEAVRGGRKVLPHSFEQAKYFEGCLPVEVMADRGRDVLAFGPMKPVGLVDPRTGRRPHAVVQLRAENRHRTAYNLVGFQTRLAYPEQQRIFRMIPGLGQAEFLRFGSIHRNSYLDSPRLLGPELELRARPNVHLAGQITGVEGYIESTAMGLVAARFVAGRLLGRPGAAAPRGVRDGGPVPARDARPAARPAVRADEHQLRADAAAGGPAVEARPPAAVRLARPGRLLRLVRRGRLTGASVSRASTAICALLSDFQGTADVLGVVCIRPGRLAVALWAALTALGCIGPNPAYRPRVEAGGGGTGGSGDASADRSPDAVGAPDVDASAGADGTPYPQDDVAPSPPDSQSLPPDMADAALPPDLTPDLAPPVDMTANPPPDTAPAVNLDDRLRAHWQFNEPTGQHPDRRSHR